MRHSTGWLVIQCLRNRVKLLSVLSLDSTLVDLVYHDITDGVDNIALATNIFTWQLLLMTQ